MKGPEVGPWSRSTASGFDERRIGDVVVLIVAYHGESPSSVIARIGNMTAHVPLPAEVRPEEARDMADRIGRMWGLNISPDPAPETGRVCSDCGNAGVWWFAAHLGGPDYCKRCWRKGGNAGMVCVDPDVLLGLVGVAGAVNVIGGAEGAW